MNLLITGATGFVGRNLMLHALRDARCESVIACVRNPKKLKDQLCAEGVHDAKVRMVPWGEPLAREVPVDHAVHAAGVLFARDRQAYFSVNVDESMRLIQSLPMTARLVVLSSQSAGGPTPSGQSQRSITDTDAPLTWYGESKLAMEQRLREVRPDALVVRPPMILGPRDQATLPLFKMAGGVLRPKPGIKDKSYSWISVNDLVRDLFDIIQLPDWAIWSVRTMYAASPDSITDRDLVRVAAELMQARGVDLPLPHPVLAVFARLVDAIPALRDATPSLTRDRVKEIFADRWVVDASDFRQLAGSRKYQSLRETMDETLRWYQHAGQIR